MSARHPFETRVFKSDVRTRLVIYSLIFLSYCDLELLVSVRLWNIFNGGSQFARFLVESQDTQSRLLCFVKTNNDSSSKRVKILLSQFYISRITQIFMIFFKVNNNSLEKRFLITWSFETLNFQKACPIFDELPFIVFTGFPLNMFIFGPKLTIEEISYPNWAIYRNFRFKILIWNFASENFKTVISLST